MGRVKTRVGRGRGTVNHDLLGGFTDTSRKAKRLYFIKETVVTRPWGSGTETFGTQVEKGQICKVKR